MVNSASRALYSEMGSVAFEEGICESQINFRNIDVDLIFNTSLDLFQFLDLRDQKFQNLMRIGKWSFKTQGKID